MAELRSTMQDFPLTLAALLRHAGDVHPDIPARTCRDGALVDSASFAEVVERTGRLAGRIPHGWVPAGVEVGRSTARPSAGSVRF